MVVVFDLDDTLYDEIDFVKSGFKEISKYLENDSYFDFMWNEFVKNGSGKVFNALIEKFDLNISIDKLIEIYRFHFPSISLSHESLMLLKYSKNYKTALISDGHYIMQQNKFQALKLAKYIDYQIFTDFYHTKKPELKAFEMVMDKYNNDEYVYVSDNPKKDFIAPNALGWRSIRFKNYNGIYKDIISDANFEVKSREDILIKLKEICER